MTGAVLAGDDDLARLLARAVPPAMTIAAASPAGQFIAIISHAIRAPLILVRDTVNCLIFRGEVHARTP
jgi:hypothetical protein